MHEHIRINHLKRNQNFNFFKGFFFDHSCHFHHIEVYWEMAKQYLWMHRHFPELHRITVYKSIYLIYAVCAVIRDLYQPYFFTLRVVSLIFGSKG